MESWEQRAYPLVTWSFRACLGGNHTRACRRPARPSLKKKPRRDLLNVRFIFGPGSQVAGLWVIRCGHKSVPAQLGHLAKERAHPKRSFWVLKTHRRRSETKV